MPKSACRPTKAKISRQLAGRAREALQEDYEIRVYYAEPAPVRILDRRKSFNAGEEFKGESEKCASAKEKDAVEEAKCKFEEEFNLCDSVNGETRTPLVWGKPAIFQHYDKREIGHPSRAAYHGILALSDNCDLPGGYWESGDIGQGYYWDADTPVTWECKGGGYCISFAFAKK